MTAWGSRECRPQPQGVSVRSVVVRVRVHWGSISASVHSTRFPHRQAARRRCPVAGARACRVVTPYVCLRPPAHATRNRPRSLLLLPYSITRSTTTHVPPFISIEFAWMARVLHSKSPGDDGCSRLHAVVPPPHPAPLAKRRVATAPPAWPERRSGEDVAGGSA